MKPTTYNMTVRHILKTRPNFVQTFNVVALSPESALESIQAMYAHPVEPVTYTTL